MAHLPTGRFLSLIPELHQSAVIKDSAVTDSAPQSPSAQPVDQTEKTRRSSSSASAVSQDLPNDTASKFAGMSFLKLGQ